MRWSFEELGQLSRQVANVLTQVCGLQQGDRAVVLLPRIPEWWLLNVACMRAGRWARLGLAQGAAASWEEQESLWLREEKACKSLASGTQAVLKERR